LYVFHYRKWFVKCLQLTGLGKVNEIVFSFFDAMRQVSRFQREFNDVVLDRWTSVSSPAMHQEEILDQSHTPIAVNCAYHNLSKYFGVLNMHKKLTNSKFIHLKTIVIAIIQTLQSLVLKYSSRYHTLNASDGKWSSKLVVPLLLQSLTQVHILVVAINTVEAMVIATIQPH